MQLPHHNAAGLQGCIGGRFATRGGRIVLLDDRGNAYDLDRCTILMGGWGDQTEGVQKLPRVEVLDEGGKVLVPGDRVVIFHVQGNPRRPVVLGGVRPLRSNDFLARRHDEDHADQNALRVRLLARNTSTGVEGGRVDLEAGAGAGGQVDLDATAGVTVRVGEDPDAATALELDLSATQVTVSRGGATQPVTRGTAFLTALQAALTEISGLLNGLGLATPTTAAFLTNITTSLSSGAPYLSSTLESE